MDDCILLGFIKVKFPLIDKLSLRESAFMPFCRQFKSLRVTGHFVYLALGHDDIPDNHIGAQLLLEIERLGGKVTRLDFCVDVAQKFDIKHYHELMCIIYESKEPRRKMGLPSLLASPVGITCYIGKRSSSRMLRIYDKRAETLYRKKVDIEFDLTRFEIEVKREQVTRYRALFLTGNTQAILDDIAARYSLPWLSASPAKMKPAHIPEKRERELAFVERYKGILGRAWSLDKAEFLDIIGNPL